METTQKPTRLPGATPRRYAVLAIGAAVLTIGLKLGAYFLTGSVGLLSDAAESVVNLVAALVALWALSVAALPPDSQHAYGHGKAEYFSSALESVLIFVAAVAIALAAWPRLFQPRPLENVWLGLLITTLASAVNGGVAWVLLRAGRRYRSITLRADAHHLLTDVWTSVGVIVGVMLVNLTGWLVLDPIIALLVAANIVWTAVRLLMETGSGLLDSTLPTEDMAVIDAVLAPHRAEGIQFHAVRTRAAGPQRFVSLHVLVPGDWPVLKGHAFCHRLEQGVATALPNTAVDTHLEALEDPVSWDDPRKA